MLDLFEEVYDNNWFVLGKKVMQFEQEYAAFSGTKYAIGVSNGLDALVLALKALNIGYGDEVIVPSNTYIATALAVTNVGATPVFVEPELSTYNIDPGKIRRAINSKSKAIIPVHLYGQACDMDSLISVASKHNLFIVEDNAQAHGASFAGKQTGSWGDINATSFYPSKNLGALGDGGAVTTNNELFEKRIKVLRNYGSDIKYKNEVTGYNMRLDECQAAFLSLKLRYLSEWTSERQQVAEWYTEGLSGMGDIILPSKHKDATHVYHVYIIRTKKRDSLGRHLSEHGIGTLIHYPIPPHLQNAYRSLGYKPGDFPIAEEIADTCLSLPIWPGLQKSDIEYIVETINQFFYA